MPQGAELLDQILLDGLTLLAGACLPIRHYPLVEPEGSDESLQWATMREQRHHEHHQCSRSPQPVEDGALRDGESFVALLADKPLLCARMEADIPLASLALWRDTPDWGRMLLWGP